MARGFPLTSPQLWTFKGLRPTVGSRLEVMASWSAYRAEQQLAFRVSLPGEISASERAVTQIALANQVHLLLGVTGNC